MSASLRVLATALALTLLPAAANAEEKRAVTIDDLMAIQSVSSADISPDGKWIAYAVRRNDLKKDKTFTRLWMASSDGKTVLPLTGETYSASDPQWSPDGTQLAFLAARSDLDEDAATQVWTLDMRGGEAVAYTDVTQGVDGFEWAPDGQRMLLLITDESANTKADREAEEKGETAKEHPFVIDRLQFKADGVGYLGREYTHIYVIAGRGEEAKQLTFGQRDDDGATWSPDGTEIAYVTNVTDEPDSNYNSDIFVVSGTPSEEPAEPRRITSNPGQDSAPAWSPDGKQIAYTASTKPELIWYATTHLALASAAGGGERILTEALDRNVYEPAFSADGKSIYFMSEDSGAQPVSAYDLKKGTVRQVIGGPVSVSGFDEGPKGKLAAVISQPDLPNEVFIKDAKALTQVTRTNAAVLDAVALSQPQFIAFENADGDTVQAFVYPAAPAADGTPPPAILFPHGGPVAQYDYSFDSFAQIFAANGYTTILINPRGSSGRGETFASAIWADWGNKDYDDEIAGLDKVIEMGLADADRIGVGGWSYGGIMTNYLITKSDRFKGAVSGASEAHYTANYGHDIYQREWEMELGLPWENQEGWDGIAPFFDVGKVTTPTLFMGGQVDWNVPIINSEGMYLALRRRGIDTELVVYPGEDHSIGRPSFVVDRYQRFVDWYDTHVKGAE